MFSSSYLSSFLSSYGGGWSPSASAYGGVSHRPRRIEGNGPPRPPSCRGGPPPILNRHSLSFSMAMMSLEEIYQTPQGLRLGWTFSGTLNTIKVRLCNKLSESTPTHQMIRQSSRLSAQCPEVSVVHRIDHWPIPYQSDRDRSLVFPCLWTQLDLVYRMR